MKNFIKNIVHNLYASSIKKSRQIDTPLLYLNATCIDFLLKKKSIDFGIKLS